MGDPWRLLSRGEAVSDLGVKGTPCSGTWRMDSGVQGKSWEPGEGDSFWCGVGRGGEGGSDSPSATERESSEVTEEWAVSVKAARACNYSPSTSAPGALSYSYICTCVR